MQSIFNFHTKYLQAFMLWSLQELIFILFRAQYQNQTITIERAAIESIKSSKVYMKNNEQIFGFRHVQNENVGKLSV